MLVDLLGPRFSLRIRDSGDQRLYRLERSRSHRHVAPLIKGTVDREVILRHWQDLVRVVGSLKLGWVTASLVVTNLEAHPTRTPLPARNRSMGG